MRWTTSLVDALNVECQPLVTDIAMPRLGAETALHHRRYTRPRRAGAEAPRPPSAEAAADARIAEGGARSARLDVDADHDSVADPAALVAAEVLHLDAECALIATRRWSRVPTSQARRALTCTSSLLRPLTRPQGMRPRRIISLLGAKPRWASSAMTARAASSYGSAQVRTTPTPQASPPSSNGRSLLGHGRPSGRKVEVRSSTA
jgi:hypothetical protein